ncbi:hypothetical protein ACFJGW_16740 [Burkholderiaceae bacterium UC74_6]
MSKLHKFLNQSAFETPTKSGRFGAYAPELRGAAAEMLGLPLLLGAFAFAWIVALTTSI